MMESDYPFKSAAHFSGSRQKRGSSTEIPHLSNQNGTRRQALSSLASPERGGGPPPLGGGGGVFSTKLSKRDNQLMETKRSNTRTGETYGQADHDLSNLH
ncbi:MAG: hypothetical protein LUD78_04270 [Clostridiales bacterium]|nr:hypothetical protein [Clostridiales bacterium]